MIVFVMLAYLGFILILSFAIIAWVVEKKSKTQAVVIPRKEMRILLFSGAACLCISIIGGIICKVFF
jgi:hypothetical protein